MADIAYNSKLRRPDEPRVGLPFILNAAALTVSAAAMAAPMVVTAIERGAGSLRALAHSVISGQTEALTIFGLSVACVHLSALTMATIVRNHQEIVGQRELRAELHALAESMDEKISAINERQGEIAHTLQMLEKMIRDSNRSLLLDDMPLSWMNLVDSLTAIGGRWTHDVHVKGFLDGTYTFEGTERARTAILPRILVGSPIHRWRIVVYLPDDPAQCPESLLIARKTVFMLDYLKAVADANGQRIDADKVVLIRVPRRIPTDSLFLTTRRTPTGDVPIALNYGRADSDTGAGADVRTNYVLELRDAGIVAHLRSEADRICRQGSPISLDQLREQCRNAGNRRMTSTTTSTPPMPTDYTPVAFDDHFSIREF